MVDKNQKEHDYIMEKLDKLIDRINAFEIKVTEQIATLPGKMIEESDQRYASKSVEKWLWTLGTSLIGAIITVVVIVIEKYIK